MKVGCGSGQLLCCDGEHRSSETNDGKYNSPLAQAQAQLALGGQRQLISDFGASGFPGLSTVGQSNTQQLQQLQMQHALLQQQKDRLLQMQQLRQLQTLQLQQGGLVRPGGGIPGAGMLMGQLGIQSQLRPQNAIQQQLLLQQLQAQQQLQGLSGQGLGSQLRPLSTFQGQPQLSGLE